MTWLLAAVGPDGRWAPGIGDPSLMGWLIVAMYAGVGGLALAQLRRTRRGDARGDAPLQRMLLLIALTVLALGLIKAFDLLSWVTQLARDTSYREGWHGERRGIQTAVIAGVAGLALGAGALVARSFRTVLPRARVAVAALVLLLGFVLVRAVSFHWVDVLLRLHLSWVVEPGSLAVLALGVRRLRPAI